MCRSHSNINRSSFFTFHPTSPWSFSFLLPLPPLSCLSFLLPHSVSVFVRCRKFTTVFSVESRALFLNFLWISFPTRDAALFSIRELAQHQKVNNVQEILFPLSLSLSLFLSLFSLPVFLSPFSKNEGSFLPRDKRESDNSKGNGNFFHSPVVWRKKSRFPKDSTNKTRKGCVSEISPLSCR